MYLFDDKGRDTLFRLHGTPEWASIGTAASSGCIRLLNQDIIDLFDRVPNGTRVHVRTQSESVQYEGPVVESPEGYALPANQTPAVTPVSATGTSPVGSPITA